MRAMEGAAVNGCNGEGAGAAPAGAAARAGAEAGPGVGSVAANGLDHRLPCCSPVRPGRPGTTQADPAPPAPGVSEHFVASLSTPAPSEDLVEEYRKSHKGGVLSPFSTTDQWAFGRMPARPPWTVAG